MFPRLHLRELRVAGLYSSGAGLATRRRRGTSRGSRRVVKVHVAPGRPEETPVVGAITEGVRQVKITQETVYVRKSKVERENK